MGLGPASAIPIDHARAAALELRNLLRTGLDPLSEKRKRNASKPSFEQAASRFIESEAHRWRSRKHHQQWISTLTTYVYPSIGARPVDSVTREDVVAILAPIWTSKHETARRIRGRIEAVMAWAATNGHRTDANPARWSRPLQDRLPRPAEVHGSRSLPAMAFEDLPRFIARLREIGGTSARALEFVILTAASTREVRDARWEEIDADARTWCIPPERTRSGRLRRIPLTAPVMDLLEILPRVSEWIFTRPRDDQPLSAMAMLRMLRRAHTTPVTVHGFRFTFSSWCQERTSLPKAAADAALGRASSERPGAASETFDWSRRLLEQWARFATSATRSPATDRKLAVGSAEPSLGGPARAPRHDPDAKLTPRERDVLTLLAKGITVSACARMLGISAHTAAGHAKNVYFKLNVSSRAEATLEATRRGLVTL